MDEKKITTTEAQHDLQPEGASNGFTDGKYFTDAELKAAKDVVDVMQHYSDYDRTSLLFDAIEKTMYFMETLKQAGIPEGSMWKVISLAHTIDCHERGSRKWNVHQRMRMIFNATDDMTLDEIQHLFDACRAVMIAEQPELLDEDEQVIGREPARTRK